MKEAFDSVMSGAREVKYLSSINYKVLVKGGGREQAKRDFDEFRLSSIHHFTIRRSVSDNMHYIDLLTRDQSSFICNLSKEPSERLIHFL